MKNVIKQLILKHYPTFHKVTVFLSISFLAGAFFGYELSLMPCIAGVAALEFSELL